MFQIGIEGDDVIVSTQVFRVNKVANTGLAFMRPPGLHLRWRVELKSQTQFRFNKNNHL